MSVDRERWQAHAYLDRLPPVQLSAVRSLLESMVEPDFENEPIGEEEERSAAAARDWLKHNKPIPHNEVLADFGLTMADWERMVRAPLPEEKNGR